MKHGKKYSDSVKLIDHLKQYDPEEAVDLVLQTGKAKFDETVEISVRLGVDPRHADQQVRGAVVLPHGTGRTIRVLVIAKGDKAKEAEEAGADYVGAEEMIQKIQQENWFEFDVCVATPDMMGMVGRIGRVLGPKGLMPNPKSGTVTMDIARAIHDIKAGKVEYRLDKTAIIHCPIGKVSFGKEKLQENLNVLMDLLDHFLSAYIIGTGFFRFLGIVALGDNQKSDGPAGSVGQNHRAADLLVSVTGVNTQADGDLDGLIKLGLAGLHDQINGLFGVILLQMVDQLSAVGILLTVFHVYYSSRVVLAALCPPTLYRGFAPVAVRSQVILPRSRPCCGRFRPPCS